MKWEEFLPALVIPFVAVYHKIFVDKRLCKVETETEKQGKLLERIDERTEWIKNVLDKQYNGKRK